MLPKAFLCLALRKKSWNLGLDKAGVKTDNRGRIETDDHLRTNVENIYAIGDVVKGAMLAHKAEHEGVLCVEAIKGLHPHPMDKLMIPGCTYCHPQIASVGLTEAKAKAAGHEIKVGRFNFVANGKAITTEDAPFIVYRNRARLMDFSMSVHPGSTRPQKLLKNDGSISLEVVRSVRMPLPMT